METSNSFVVICICLMFLLTGCSNQDEDLEQNLNLNDSVEQKESKSEVVASDDAGNDSVEEPSKDKEKGDSQSETALIENRSVEWVEEDAELNKEIEGTLLDEEDDVDLGSMI